MAIPSNGLHSNSFASKINYKKKKITKKLKEPLNLQKFTLKKS